VRSGHDTDPSPPSSAKVSLRAFVAYERVKPLYTYIYMSMLLVIMELVFLSLKTGYCLLLTQILALSFCIDHTYYDMFYETCSYVTEIRTWFNSNQNNMY